MAWLPEMGSVPTVPADAVAAGQPAKKRRSLVIPALSVFAAFVLFVVNVILFVGWFKTMRAYGALQQEKAQLDASNRVLSGAHELLRNKKAQICNRGAEDMRIDWIAASFEEGGRLKSFDSQRCTDWLPIVLKGGSSRTLSLSSTQEGCNWNGSVVFFAMHYSRGTTQSYHDAGAWMGFDRECYTIQ
jgi:hypothetical protein